VNYPSHWHPKGLCEYLCNQQTFAPDDRTREAMQDLINLLNEHRPVGSNGKHGDLHTATCGCEP
jgi:hypothetical protein